MLKNSKFVLFVNLKKVGQAGNIRTLLRTFWRDERNTFNKKYTL
jgi:hypothetical protein